MDFINDDSELNKSDLIKISDDELKKLEDYLKDVVDPELGINIVDLGLVYGIAKTKSNKILLDLTLTSPACPLTDVIEDQVNDSVLKNSEYDGVEISWVWSPPWGMEMISDAGKLQLRALGFSI